MTVIMMMMIIIIIIMIFGACHERVRAALCRYLLQDWSNLPRGNCRLPDRCDFCGLMDNCFDRTKKNNQSKIDYFEFFRLFQYLQIKVLVERIRMRSRSLQTDNISIDSWRKTEITIIKNVLFVKNQCLITCTYRFNAFIL